MPAYIKTDKHTTIVFDSGEQGTMFSTNNDFDLLSESIKQSNWERAYDLLFPVEQMKKVVSGLKSDRVHIANGHVFLDDQPMHNSLTDRMLQMVSEGFDIGPMSLFLENMMDNPSYRAVTELYSFLEASNLPITDDGHFLAYKRIGFNYKDLYSGSMDNSVGKIVEMPRNQVNEDKNQTCSAGLHFCAREYLSSYGTGGNSRVVMLKINPRDVVSIPSDYNNSKGRCCRYEVFQEMDVNGGNTHRLPDEEIEGVYKDTKPVEVEVEIVITEDVAANIASNLIDDLDESSTTVDIDETVNLTIDTILEAVLPDKLLSFDALLDISRKNQISENALLKEEPLPESSLPTKVAKVSSSKAVQKLSTIKSHGAYVALETFMSAKDAMKHTGINSSSITKVCKGERNSAGGFKWRWKIVEAPIGSVRAMYDGIDIDDASCEDDEED